MFRFHHTKTDYGALKNGKTATEICEILESTWNNNSIYIAVNTLELLKKGGRITPTAAGIATALNLKPVLKIRGEKLDSFANVRGMKKAKKTMLEAIRKDYEERFNDGNYELNVAYSGDIEAANEWLTQAKEFFNDDSISLFKLPISICCHIGGGALAIAISEKTTL